MPRCTVDSKWAPVFVGVAHDGHDRAVHGCTWDLRWTAFTFSFFPLVHLVHEPAPRVPPPPLLLMAVLRRRRALALAHGGGSERLLVGFTASHVVEDHNGGGLGSGLGFVGVSTAVVVTRPVRRAAAGPL
jgi:hypothetical protein